MREIHETRIKTEPELTIVDDRSLNYLKNLDQSAETTIIRGYAICVKEDRDKFPSIQNENSESNLQDDSTAAFKQEPELTILDEHTNIVCIRSSNDDKYNIPKIPKITSITNTNSSIVVKILNYLLFHFLHCSSFSGTARFHENHFIAY